jgi:hypothetical protein
LADSFEKALDAIQPATSAWIVSIPAGLQEFVKLSQEGFLFVREVYRRFNGNFCEQIAGLPVAYRGNALGSQPEDLSGLRTRGNF